MHVLIYWRFCMQELDFEVEAGNAERCRRNLASSASRVLLHFMLAACEFAPQN